MQEILQASRRAKWKGWYFSFKLIIARYFVKHWKCFLHVPPLSFTFLCSPKTHKEPAKQLSRLRLLWAMNTGSVSLLKHLPFCLLCISLQFDKGGHCTRGTFFGFSFPSQGFSAAHWKEGYMTDKFHFMPTTIMTLLFERGGFVCKPLSGEKDEKEKTSWLHVTLNQQDTCQCLLRFLLLLSRFNFNVLACSTFPFFFFS